MELIFAKDIYLCFLIVLEQYFLSLIHVHKNPLPHTYFQLFFLKVTKFSHYQKIFYTLNQYDQNHHNLVILLH